MPKATGDDRSIPGINDALKVIQDVGEQLADAAATMAEEFSASPAARFVEPMARYSSQIAELSTMWVMPMRSMLEEQQELVDALAAWAEQQRVLSERFAKLADRHQKMTAQTLGVLQPLLQQAERIRAATKRSPD
jgi:hypothetical protein